MADSGNGRLTFSVLGPLRVERDGVEVALAGRKPKALLLRLLAAPGKAISADAIAEDLWDGRPPPSAHATLQGYVSRLRTLLGAERVVTEAGGYRLLLADDELDSACFETDVLAARAATAVADHALVVEHLRRAERRWRGEPLVDADGAAWAAGEVARLHELRVDALEMLLDAKLALGEHAEVVAAAEAAVTQHPLRERLWAQLITAMYRQGRQAEALRAFQRLRHVLVDELGIEPSAELQDLEQAILVHDPTLHAASGPERRAPSGVVTFLFTDIEGSTVLWERAPDAMQDALQRHNRIVRGAVAEHGGVVFATGGDGFAAAFQRASDAVAAALTAQEALTAEAWPEAAPMRVRMGLHTGEAVEQDGDYVGTAVNETARLMASAHGGQVVCSAPTAALIGDDVSLRDLGHHRLRDLRRPMRVFQVGQGEFPTLRSDARPGNLPVQLTSFVGRQREVAEVVTAVERSRLVTLVGVGGMGKTRLATNVAAELAPRFREGAWFVELAATNDPDAVSQVVATTVGVSQRTGLSLEESIIEYVHAWESLVVLDNCEHVLNSAAALADRIISGCPGIRILATSREALGSAAEQLWPVGPLALPDGNDPDAASVRLFLDRARLVAPRFDPDADGLAAVADICRRLDGMPLAIELAASRVTNMTPAEISQLLDERFRLLTGGRRSAVERHQSLRAAVDWSYGLLSDRDRRVFDRLAVFPGSFEAASAAAVASDDELDAWEVRDALASLVAKSLLGTLETSTTTTRYQLAETLRAYARERLDASNTTDEWRRRHAVHFAEFAQQAAAELRGPGEGLWWDRLEANLDNVRAAVTWALDHEPDAQLAVAIITDLGHASQAEPRLGIHGWAEPALLVADAASAGRRAVLRAMAAHHMHITGQPTSLVRPLAEAAVVDGIPPECPGPSLIVVPLAVCEIWEGHQDRAVQTVIAAARAIESAGYGVYDRWAAHSLVAGVGAGFGDSATAIAHAEIALRCARETGCPTALGVALSRFGWAVINTDEERAFEALSQTVALAEAGAHISAHHATLALLARLHLQRGDLEKAARVAHAAVFETYRQGDRSLMWGVFMESILIADGLLDYELAGILVGATVRRSRGAAPAGEFMVPGGDAALEAIADVGRQRLGATAWMELEARGAAMSVDELAVEVLGELERQIERLSTQTATAS